MIKKVELKDIPMNGVGIKTNRVKRDVTDFLSSKMDAAEVDVSLYKSASSAAASYAVAAKRIGGVRVIQRSGKLYLIRTEESA